MITAVYVISTNGDDVEVRPYVEDGHVSMTQSGDELFVPLECWGEFREVVERVADNIRALQEAGE